MTIYFLQDALDPNGLIKIGYSDRVRSRASDLSREEGIDLTVLAAIPGEFEQERFFHKRFEEHRVRGEWFEPVPALLALIGILGVEDGLALNEDDQRASLRARDAQMVWECADALRALVHAEKSGRDSVETSMRRIAGRLGVPYNVIWSLRYRPPDSVTAAVYERLTSSTAVAQAEAFLRSKDGAPE